jgi:hypothetical protein
MLVPDRGNLISNVLPTLLFHPHGCSIAMDSIEQNGNRRRPGRPVGHLRDSDSLQPKSRLPLRRTADNRLTRSRVEVHRRRLLNIGDYAAVRLASSMTIACQVERDRFPGSGRKRDPTQK